MMICECCRLEKEEHDHSKEICEECCESLILVAPYKVNENIITYDLQESIDVANGIKKVYK